jgi:hypothetical protein
MGMLNVPNVVSCFASRPSLSGGRARECLHAVTYTHTHTHTPHTHPLHLSADKYKLILIPPVPIHYHKGFLFCLAIFLTLFSSSKQPTFYNHQHTYLSSSLWQRITNLFSVCMSFSWFSTFLDFDILCKAPQACGFVQTLPGCPSIERPHSALTPTLGAVSYPAWRLLSPCGLGASPPCHHALLTLLRFWHTHCDTAASPNGLKIEIFWKEDELTTGKKKGLL